MPSVTGADGNRLVFEVSGQGPDLLLVHGITENRGSWGQVATALSAEHRVIAVDLRGHGESDPAPGYALEAMAADLAVLTEHVGAQRPALVGHSLGGAVVSVYAASHPARAVVNVDQVLALAAFQDQLHPVEPMLRDAAGFPQVIAGLFDQLMGPLGAEDRARLSALRRPDQQVVLGVWEPIFTLDAADLDTVVRGLLAGLEAPYLSLHGSDPGAEYRQWLAAVIPQARVEVWPDTGHYPHLMQSQRFVELVTRFCA